MSVDQAGDNTVQPELMLAKQIDTVARESVQIQASAKNFAASAGQGFHIDPQAAATLINACRDALNQLESVQFHVYNVSQAPKLGQTPGADVIAPFTQSAATDHQGVQQAITNLKSTLQQMIQAYQKASTNYQETEQLVAQAMRREHARLGTTPGTAAAPLILNS